MRESEERKAIRAIIWLCSWTLIVVGLPSMMGSCCYGNGEFRSDNLPASFTSLTWYAVSVICGLAALIGAVGAAATTFLRAGSHSSCPSGRHEDREAP